MSNHLQRINGPADLRQLSNADLAELAQEIRDVIIATTAEHGGHLASNLGVVELTLALHLCFDSPRDKLIWDVGHQCYAHKLLTGRRAAFDTLRQGGGLSGYVSPEESEHDAFAAGHGSTALSAALGFAAARGLAGRHGHVVAVVGDGALQGGMSLEALNQAGHLGVDLIAVLNDNEMSIARNVGALANYLSRLRSDPYYLRARDEFNQIMHRTPLGEAMLEAVEWFKDGVKRLALPGMLFEDLGLTYLGPVNGHDLADLRDVLGHAKNLKGAVLVHVLTTKGRGYKPAEDQPEKWHGAAPFDVAAGAPREMTNGRSYTAAFGEAVVELGWRDERIVGITAAMADGTGMERFASRFPTRCWDVGMCEQHAVTFAAGLAKAGLRPVVAIYSTFLQRAYDQIVHDVCLQNLPVIFCLDRAGLVGDDGPTHHGVFDLAYLRHVPNMAIIAPADPSELQPALECALAHSGPVALRYPRGLGPQEPLTPQAYEFGRGVVARPGDDVVVLALGTMVAPALAAAAALAAEGLSLGVVNCRFAKPLDEGLILEQGLRAGRVITAEEGALAGGFGSAVLELLGRRGAHQVEVVRLGIPDRFIEHGEAAALQAGLGLDAAGIIEAARRLCREPRPSSAPPTPAARVP